MFTGRRQTAMYGGMAGSALLTIGLWGSPAQARLSGSIHVGKQQTTITRDGGRVESRTTGGLLNVSFGRGPGSRHTGTRWSGVRLVAAGAGSRGRYGRMNSGHIGTFEPDGVVRDYTGSHDPLWSGLIDANIAQMRRTSPYPNRYGILGFNRPPVFRRPGTVGYGGFSYPWYSDFYSFGFGFGSAPLYYGGFVPSIYSYYGSWYPQYLPQERVYIIEREVPRNRDDRDDRAEPRREERSERSDRAAPANPPTSWVPGEGDYYLAPRSGETLEDAVADIHRAWMNGDFARFKARTREEGKVRVYLKGKYKYSVDAADFGQMTRDAMTRVDTISFALDPVKRRDENHAFVSGKHVYYDPDHQKHEVYVSYGLVREGGHWRIAEAGSSSEPISSHSD
jgi:hypothetical protein